MRQDFDQNVKKPGQVIDAEVQYQKDFALLRMTEAKVEAELRVKQLEQLLRQKDAYIDHLEVQLQKSGIRPTKPQQSLALAKETDDLNDRASETNFKPYAARQASPLQGQR